MTRPLLPSILLVDDQPNNLLALKDVLENVEADLLLAHSGNEALALLTQHECALVLLDVQMPEMDGIEVATLMRQVDATKHIPIIFVTAFGQNTDMTFKGYEVGAVDYLHKPIVSEILQSKVHVFLDLHQQKRQLEWTVHDLEVSQADLKQRTEELARSNADLNVYASVASHELQEPLRRMHIFGDILKRECSEQLSEEGQEYVSKIQTSALRMQSLIKGILSLSKVHSQGQSFTTVNLNDLVSDVVSDLQDRLDDAQARVDVGTLPHISGDSVQLEQIFKNLIGNSLKFQHVDRPLVITISSMSLQDSAENCCQILLEDNGIGFLAKHQERIFGMFKRLHASQEYEGTGIGLALCQKILERHGGTISATGKKGEGAIFSIRLPMNQASPVRLVQMI